MSAARDSMESEDGLYCKSLKWSLWIVQFEDHSIAAEFVRGSDDEIDLEHDFFVQVVISFSKCPYFYCCCVTIGTILFQFSLINYAWLCIAFVLLSESIYFYINFNVMAMVFNFLAPLRNIDS